MYYGNMAPFPSMMPCKRQGNGFATILVLFILLAIIGAWTLGY